jgi:hypothetical protein
MTCPKIMPCPNCGAPGTDLSVYTYENGWRHVVCCECSYLGPGAGNIIQAIRDHNQRSMQKAKGETP